MREFRGRASASIMAITVIVAIASCLLLSACLGGGGDDGAAAESAPRAAEFRTLALLAGPADRGGAGDVDGLGSQARLNGPTGLALAGDGSLWVSQIENGKIKRISPEGEVRTVVDLGALPAQVDAKGRQVVYGRPGAMVAGAAGEAYVAVQRRTSPTLGADGTYQADGEERWAVLRVSAAGQADLHAVANAQEVGSQATALAVNRRGELFIADTFRCSIWRADGKGDAVLVHTNAPHGDGKPCQGSWGDAITRLTIDTQDRVVYAAGSGALRRMEADGSVSQIGSGTGYAFDCGAIAYAPNGDLVVTNGSPQVYRVSPSGYPSVWVGSAMESGWFDGAPLHARFSQPCGLAVNAAGDAFVADRKGHTVRRISRAGIVSTLAGLAAQEGFREGQGAQVHFGEGLTLAPARDGAVWVVDGSNNVIRHVDMAGTTTTAAGILQSGVVATDGPRSRATFTYPGAVAESSDGTLWIADLFSVRRLGTDGMLNTRSVNPRGFLLALAPDSAGNLLVLSGSYIVSIDGPTTSYFQFSRYAAQSPLDAAPTLLETRLPSDLELQVKSWVLLPTGMCVARSGELYYSQGHAVMRRGTDGAVTVHAGAVMTAGSDDGSGADARFNQPAGLACVEDGAVFVADSGNHTVRRISAQRSVTTVLGRAGQAGNIFGAAPGGLDTPRSLALVPGGLVVSSGLGIVIARY